MPRQLEGLSEKSRSRLGRGSVTEKKGRRKFGRGKTSEWQGQRVSPSKRVIKLKVMQVAEAGQWQGETHGEDEGRHVLESNELALSVTTWAHIYEHKMSFF